MGKMIENASAGGTGPIKALNSDQESFAGEGDPDPRGNYGEQVHIGAGGPEQTLTSDQEGFAGAVTVC